MGKSNGHSGGKSIGHSSGGSIGYLGGGSIGNLGGSSNGYLGNGAAAVLARFYAEWNAIDARRNHPYLKKVPKNRMFDYSGAAASLGAVRSDLSSRVLYFGAADISQAGARRLGERGKGPLLLPKPVYGAEGYSEKDNPYGGKAGSYAASGYAGKDRGYEQAA